MKRTSVVLLATVLFGCTSETGTRSGTSVGNPTVVGLTAGRTDGLSLEAGRIVIDTVVLEDCAGGSVEIDVGRSIALFEDTIEIPEGSWCTQTITTSGPLNMEGSWREGTYTILVDAPEIFLSGRWDVETEAAFVVELGRAQWLSSVLPEFEVPGEVMIGLDHAAQANLSNLLERASALFPDGDGDGQVGDDEREGRISSGEDREERTGGGDDERDTGRG